MDWHHYCKKCLKWFECTHKDPELTSAKCPECGGKLTLGRGSLEVTRKTLVLGKAEVGVGQVTYTLL